MRYGDPVGEVDASVPVSLILLVGVCLLAVYAYWDGYGDGRCHDQCGAVSATLCPDGTCTCDREGVGTVARLWGATDIPTVRSIHHVRPPQPSRPRRP
ncbi:MAG: hypothetical protein EBT79_07470 [Actinobacteria bacterium]|nr:hypothetical protein [Actinomycetota bacterium]NBR67098.1 hypothetical protein [Actinomycetota bacterium]